MLQKGVTNVNTSKHQTSKIKGCIISEWKIGHGKSHSKETVTISSSDYVKHSHLKESRYWEFYMKSLDF